MTDLNALFHSLSYITMCVPGTSWLITPHGIALIALAEQQLLSQWVMPESLHPKSTY